MVSQQFQNWSFLGPFFSFLQSFSPFLLQCAGHLHLYKFYPDKIRVNVWIEFESDEVCKKSGWIWDQVEKTTDTNFISILENLDKSGYYWDEIKRRGRSMSFFPDFILILSRFYPDFILISSWFYPNLIHILFKFFPDKIKIRSG